MARMDPVVFIFIPLSLIVFLVVWNILLTHGAGLCVCCKNSQLHMARLVYQVWNLSLDLGVAMKYRLIFLPMLLFLSLGNVSTAAEAPRIRL